MSNVTRKTLLALLVVIVGVLGLTTATHASTTIAQPDCGDTSSYDKVPLGDLPPEATDTVEIIEQGPPFPFPQDGTVFENREDLLPDCAVGYYHEYTVKTPGSPDRGARRIVTGDAGEHFYTADHYQSFVLIDLGSATCGNPFSLPEGGMAYQNREGVLLACASGY